MDNWRRWNNENHNQRGTRMRSQSGKPPVGNWQPTVPSWEKKFCWEVGSVPWRKLLETKTVLPIYDNILKWDDSAAEEAFNNAKARYWAGLNGLPCDIPVPDPYAHIDDIDWNDNSIDTELILDLDRDFVGSNYGERVLIIGEEFAKSKGLSKSGWGDEEEDDDVKLIESYLDKLRRPHADVANVWVDYGGGWDNEPPSENKIKENDDAVKNGWDSKVEETGTSGENNGWNCDSRWKQWGNKVNNSGNNWEDGGYNSNYKESSGRYMSRYKTTRFHGNDRVNNQWESNNDFGDKLGDSNKWNNDGGYNGNYRGSGGRHMSRYKTTRFYGDDLTNNERESKNRYSRKKDDFVHDRNRPINYHGSANHGNN